MSRILGPGRGHRWTSLLVRRCFVLAAAGLCAGCGREPEPVSRAQLALLQRQVRALDTLVAAARVGPLVKFDQSLIAIDQALLQKLLSAALPYQTTVAGRFRVRITQVQVTCEDGFALVRLDGRVSLADQAEKDGFADVTLYGGLRAFDLDPEQSVLRGRVDVIAFETRRVELLGERNESVAGLIHDLARLRIEAFQGADYAFDIPVSLVHDIVLPEIGPEGGVHIHPARIPLHVAVTDVKALRGKLWISLRLYERSSSPDTAASDSNTAAGIR